MINYFLILMLNAESQRIFNMVDNDPMKAIAELHRQRNMCINILRRLKNFDYRVKVETLLTEVEKQIQNREER